MHTCIRKCTYIHTQPSPTTSNVHTREHRGERKLHTLARTPCSRWKVCHLHAVQGVNKKHFPQHRFGSSEFFMINISHQHYITAARSSKLPFLNIYVLNIRQHIQSRGWSLKEKALTLVQSFVKFASIIYLTIELLSHSCHKLYRHILQLSLVVKVKWKLVLN